MIALGLGVWCLALPLPLHVHLTLLGLGGGAVLWFCPCHRVDVPRRWSYGLIAFVAATGSSVLHANDPQRGLLVSVGLAPSLLLGYALATRIRGTALYYVLRLLVVMAGTMATIFSWIALTHPSDDPAQWMARAGYALFSVPNDLLFLCLLSPFALYLTIHGRGREKALGASVALAIFICIVLYETRGGLLLFALAVALLFFKEQVRFRAAALVPLAAAFLLFGYWTKFGLLEKIAHFETLTARLPVWLAAWRMFLDDPWFGQGPGAFALLYPRYATALDPAFWPAFDTRLMPWAHHLYLELLSERGAFGLGAFALLLTGVYPLLRQRKTNRMERPERYMAIGATSIALTLTAIGGLFEFSLLRYWFLVMLSLLFSIPMAYSLNAEEIIRED